ncbi:hypothetical protein EV121DRAFT_274858 [Schizophyllum commune]
MPEPGQDSSKGESPKNRTKGPWRKSHVSVLRRLGRRLVDAVRYYAKLYNRSVNSVWRQMMLEVPYGRKANLANLHRQRYRIVHPKRPEESRLEYNQRCTEDYIQKVGGASLEAKDKLRHRILADLVRLGEDVVNVPAGVRINACLRQLQEAAEVYAATDDIIVLGACVYVGDDHRPPRDAKLFCGSPLAWDVVSANTQIVLKTYLELSTILNALRLQQSESYLKFPDAPAGNDDIDPQPAIGAKAKRKQKAAPITATAPSTSIGRGATATTLRESFKNSIQAQFVQRRRLHGDLLDCTGHPYPSGCWTVQGLLFCERINQGLLKLESWSKDERRLTPGSVEYLAVALVKDIDGTALLNASDVKAALFSNEIMTKMLMLKATMSLTRKNCPLESRPSLNPIEEQGARGILLK